jgi:hypothetical protein
MLHSIYIQTNEAGYKPAPAREYFESFLFLTIAKRIQKNIPTIVAIEKIIPIFYCEGEKK